MLLFYNCVEMTGNQIAHSIPVLCSDQMLLTCCFLNARYGPQAWENTVTNITCIKQVKQRNEDIVRLVSLPDCFSVYDSFNIMTVTKAQ